MKISDENLTHTYEDELYVVHIMVYSANILVLMTAKDTADMADKIRNTDFSYFGDIIDNELAVTICEHFRASKQTAMQALFAYTLGSRDMNAIPYVISTSSGKPVLIKNATDFASLRTLLPLKIWHIRDKSSFDTPYVTKKELGRLMDQSEDSIRYSVLTDKYLRMSYDFNKKNELELDGYVRKGERAAFVFYDMSVSKIVNALEQIYTTQSVHVRPASTMDFFYISHKDQHLYKIACDNSLQFIPLESILL